MDFIKTTEQDSNYNHLEKMDIIELLIKINASLYMSPGIITGIPLILIEYGLDASKLIEMLFPQNLHY